MANKSTIISNVNGFLTAIITQLKVRNASLELIKELYSDAVSDNQTNETYTTKSGTTINYSLTLKKVGNQPMLKGTITNTGLSMITTQNVFAWKNNEFKPKAGFTYLFDAKQGNSVVKCLLNSTGLSISSPMASGIYFIDNFQIYIAQD